NKIRDIITALLVADNLADMPKLPGWKLHRLTGDRKGQWSITITGNLRLTFEIQKDEIYDLNLEDYH
ncbi:MAG: type II toxin-antitoxin system RelE/ParE family toxin, partial [Nitrospinae bacterium]|nr:type II toxin-antitoxin system RelE/ParE family toxin [Nitrospinota bacterium]